MSLRSHVILAVFKRNFLSYFSSVIGYLFIVAFVGLAAYRAFTPEFFADNQANLDHLNNWFPMLLLFIVPAISMTSWSDEKKQGTDELLFTLPATDLEILLGKYFSVVAIYSTALLFSFLFGTCAVLGFLTGWDFEIGLIIANYFGYWVSGSSLLAAGMVASILTSSPTVAFILGAAICGIPLILGRIPVDAAWWRSLSIEEHLRDFGLGLIPLSDIIYFASIAGLMLYINLALIAKRHWSGGPDGVPMGLHYLARSFCLALILFGVNVVMANSIMRIDCTSERLYTLNQATESAIQSIKPKQPVLIQAFISPRVPGEYSMARNNLIGLLRQMDAQGGDKVRVRIVDTEPYSKAADEAKGFKINPQRLQTQRAGRFSLDSVFLGCVVSSGSDLEVVIPFFDIGTPIEYELTRAIKTVSAEKRLKIGVLTTDAKMFGGFDQQTFRSSPEWRIVTDLKKQYEVEQVSPDSPINGDYAALIAAMPSSLTEPQLQNLVDYVKQGKPTLVFDDPIPFMNLQLAPRLPKPSPNQMFGQGAPPTPKADAGKATRLISLLGCAWDNGEVLFDDYNPHPEYVEVVSPELIWVGAKSPGKASAFNPASKVTRGLQEMLVPFSGTIRPRENSKLEFTPLLRTSAKAGVVRWEDLVEETPAFFGMGGPRLKGSEDVTREAPSGEQYVLAAHIKSPASDKDAAEKVNVIYVCDIDLISDWFYDVREKELFELKEDNIAFVLDCVDELAGDESLIPLRKRRARQRTLTTVEKLTENFSKERADVRREAEEAGKQELEDARKRLQERVDEIQNDKTLDPRTRRIQVDTAQQEESQKLLVMEADIRNKTQQKVEAAKAKSERQIRQVETSIGIGAVLLPPIPALLLGLYVALTRIANERRSVNPDRLVKK